jgi:putative phosphoribosyl transferase
MYANRQEAGQRLAELLSGYAGADVYVLAIPRGGVPVAYEVAKRLSALLELLVVRKLPLPDNPESGFGAIAEDGSTYVVPYASRSVPDVLQQRIMREQQTEMARRVRVLRRGRPLPDIDGCVVILVDDGLAMGSTMRAAVQCCRDRRAKCVIVAVPVAGTRVRQDLERMADAVYVGEEPPGFRAVAQVYEHWHDVPDEEVLAIMDRWSGERKRR